MHGVTYTPRFERLAKEAGIDEDELQEIAARIAADPLGGDLIKGSGGARKIRHPARGRGSGKSGGYRTIHYYGGDDVPLFLLLLVDKAARADLSRDELVAVAQLTERLALAYRRRS